MMTIKFLFYLLRLVALHFKECDEHELLENKIVYLNDRVRFMQKMESVHLHCKI